MSEPFSFYLYIVKEEPKEEPKKDLKDQRPSRHDFRTMEEWHKAFKLWEIARGDYKPTKRDFKDEAELKKQIEIYNNALKNKRQ